MEKMDAEELQERIENCIKAIVPPEHKEQLMEDLLWGNVSPFKRDLGGPITFIDGKAHYHRQERSGEIKLTRYPYTKDGFAYREDNNEPFIQSMDSFYFACILSPKVEELIDYMKANMLAPTQDEHYDILAANLRAQHIHLTSTKHNYFSLHGVSQSGYSEMGDKAAHHEKLITQAIIDYNITEESIQASQGNREPLEGLEQYLPLLQRNKLNNTLSEKPLTKAQQLSNDIESEDFTYKPATTRTARTKL